MDHDRQRRRLGQQRDRSGPAEKIAHCMPRGGRRFSQWRTGSRVRAAAVPKSVRAGMGAHFNLNIHENVPLIYFYEKHFFIIGADSSGSSYLRWKKPLEKKKWVLVLGNEANGISEENQALLIEAISIPIYGIGE